MFKSLMLFLVLCFVVPAIYAQTPIDRSLNLPAGISAERQTKLLAALDTLFVHINKDKPLDNEITAEGRKLNFWVFSSLKGIEHNEKEKNEHWYQPKLINLYALDSNRYFISVGFVNNTSTGISLRAVVNFVAAADSGKITFSVPAYYLTRNWRIIKVGNITYHYPDFINLQRAKAFDKNNSKIAGKLGLQPDKFDFYLCDNYQEVLRLLGFTYDSESVGIVNSGYGGGDGIIFSVMHNEDFSHDIFHNYASKVRSNVRNGAAEEGIAYSWGNAYYVDEHGEMITQKQLVPLLKVYLNQHPGTSLLELFNKNPKIFSLPAKVRSLIASLVSDEVERQKGIAGIKALINCGKGDESYFTVINQLIGINTLNFEVRVKKLVDDYK